MDGSRRPLRALRRDIFEQLRPVSVPRAEKPSATVIMNAAFLVAREKNPRSRKVKQCGPSGSLPQYTPLAAYTSELRLSWSWREREIISWSSSSIAHHRVSASSWTMSSRPRHDLSDDPSCARSSGPADAADLGEIVEESSRDSKRPPGAIADPERNRAPARRRADEYRGVEATSRREHADTAAKPRERERRTSAPAERRDPPRSDRSSVLGEWRRREDDLRRRGRGPSESAASSSPSPRTPPVLGDARAARSTLVRAPARRRDARAVELDADKALARFWTESRASGHDVPAALLARGRLALPRPVAARPASSSASSS